MQKFIVEYLRPWKLSTLAIGLGLLLIGAEYEQAPDWDYPISFIMASLTYLTAPWAVQVLRSQRWRWLPLALFWYYFTVDGSYWLYWSNVKPEALEMREANFLTSSCLYWLCGFIWLHDGPLKTLVSRQTSDATRPAEQLSIRTITSRLAITIILCGAAYFFYSAATGTQRVKQLCREITPGMTVDRLNDFAAEHGLGPRKNLNAQTKLAYLAETRTMGRHACRVELAEGKVKNVTYNYAD